MVLKNKLGIENKVELSRIEERITKRKALELFDRKILDRIEIGTFSGLSEIHRFLFENICDFAGEIRKENIAKGHFRFASVLYLEEALKNIDRTPHGTFDEIVEKYVEMNIEYPFREGNGRSMRIWLDVILKKEIQKVVDWGRIGKQDYLLAMERSPIRNTEIRLLLKEVLTSEIGSREVYMKGIDVSYSYEGYSSYSIYKL